MDILCTAFWFVTKSEFVLIEMIKPLSIIIGIFVALLSLYIAVTSVREGVVGGREVTTMFKILFVLVSTMFLVAVNNSVNLPAAQFIYGRF